MSNTFYYGQKNYIQILNTMYDNFAAGPYNALPLSGGTLTGPVNSTSTFIASGIVQSNTKLVSTNYLQIGPFVSNTLNTVGTNAQTQGMEEFTVINSARFFVGSGPGGAGAATTLNVGCNNSTNRSINTGGTINASGADYAEYLVKSLLCGTIEPGQIVGVNSEGKLTDKWDDSVSYAIKSTNPCMVGGDNWASHLGERPMDIADQGEYDVELEKIRKTVDRIAFAGQVPVNIMNTVPGQYIVPVKSGAGIKGVVINESDMTLQQYMKAVGKVIAIEPDGRARVIVKVV